MEGHDLLGLTFVVLSISTPAPSPASFRAPAGAATARPAPGATGAERPFRRGVGRSGAAARAGGDDDEADELFARRARRRMATYLRLRLLEMREAGLARAADVIERRLVPLATEPGDDGR